jgi:2-polyprenyl-6-methoxyphenol hydroxylase-like FAD-dependent oxidoreductase
VGRVQTQVAIVGGGPVGLGLALDLGQRGISVVVLEEKRDLHRIPKGQNLTQRTMEHFRLWGVEDQIRAGRMMPVGYPSVGINAWGNLMSQYAHPWFKRSQVDRFYFTHNERLPQYRTEEVLRSRLTELPTVQTLYGTTALDVDQNDQRALVSTKSEMIDATFVVGCDGSHSVVRNSSGIGEHRSDHNRRMVLLVFRSASLHRLLEDRYGQASFFNILHPDLDGYWRFLGRVDAAGQWFFHAPVSPDANPDQFDHERLLHEAVGADFDVELEHVGFWDLRIATADTYRSGRIFIAGDAAHSHPPYGGYGINTGLEDARNLGWKIQAQIEGWAGPNLLDSYTEERLPVFESTARDFIAAFIEADRAFIAAHDPVSDRDEFTRAWQRRAERSNVGVTEFEPHYEGSPIVFGPTDGRSAAVGSHSFAARAGHHIAPPDSADAGEIFASLGSGFCLLTSDPAVEAAEAITALAQRLGVPVRVVQTVMDSYGSTRVLVRPDHFVAWVDDGSPFDFGSVLARATGF